MQEIDFGFFFLNRDFIIILLPSKTCENQFFDLISALFSIYISNFKIMCFM